MIFNDELIPGSDEYSLGCMHNILGLFCAMYVYHVKKILANKTIVIASCQIKLKSLAFGSNQRNR